MELALDDERERGEGERARGLRAPIEEVDIFGSVKTREGGCERIRSKPDGPSPCSCCSRSGDLGGV